MMTKTASRLESFSVRLFLALMCAICAMQESGHAQEPEAARSGSHLSDRRIVQTLQSDLTALSKRDEFSGAVLISRHGRALFEHAYGFADHAFNVRNDINTKFNLGSMGKMFTGVAILQLVQQGQLSLDDKLGKYLPDYPNAEVAKEVTIRELLTHTSGLGDFFNSEFYASSMDRFNTLQSLLPLFADKPLLFKPGARWSYSNAGFIVLGLVIERVSHQSYYEYVRKRIFEPAGMNDTGNWPANADVQDRALGYTSMGQPAGAPRKSNIFVLQRGGSAGGGYSTAGDLLRFVEALWSHRLLDSRYTRLYLTGQVPTGEPGVQYGFGIETRIVNGVRIIGHSGGGPGISSNLDIYPVGGYVVIVLSNFDAGAYLINEKLRMELTGQPLPVPLHLAPAILRSYVGQYAPVPPPDAPKMRMLPITVTARGDGLWIEAGARHQFVPMSRVEFFDSGSPNVHMTFSVDPAGHVSGFTVTGLGPVPMKARRLP